jgi:AcrR family transcriptional regulator
VMARPSNALLKQNLILEAAAEIIMESGASSVTMSSIAQASGVSRSGIYQYFSSREHILAELVINDMADLANELDKIVSQTSSPEKQLELWVQHTLTHLLSSYHRVVSEISIKSLPEESRSLLRSMHGQFMLSLMSPLGKLSPEDSQALAGFVYSSVVAAAKRIEEGGDFETEAATLKRFVISGVVG